MVEMADTSEIIDNPLHPYTKKLLSAVPDINFKIKVLNKYPSIEINSFNGGNKCVYFDDCEEKIKYCSIKVPELELIKNNRYIACNKDFK